MTGSAVLNFWGETLLPAAADVWARLEVPSWETYQPALQACASDIWKAGQSSAHLSYLTFRPLSIFFLMILEILSSAARVLFRVLLSQGWFHLKRGLLQLKVAAIWFYRFQISLSRTELLGEAALVGAAVAAYFFYDWIRRQTYWRRFTRWCTTKKRKTVQATNKVLDRVARVSLILAMALPHAAFLGGYVAFKGLFPSVVKWLAFDTYATALLSIWYPLIMTLSWVHEWRHGKVFSANNPATPLRKERLSPRIADSSNSNNSSKQPSYTRSTASKNAKEVKAFSNRRRTNGVFPRTTPVSPGTPHQRTRARKPQTPSIFVNEPEAATVFWLRYWVVYAIIQLFGTLTMVPIFGSFVVQRPYLLHICCELKLLFFIWLFSMEKIIGATIPEDNALMAKSSPLAIIDDHLAPLLLDFETVVAGSVSEDFWKRMVYSKAQGLLEVLVMVKIISETRKDWLLHIVEEARTLLLPSITLFMPSFVTAWGVAYVHLLVPSVKSTRALQTSSKTRRPGEGHNEEREILYLQYWIVHCLVSGILSYFSSLLWWIPFSTHATFLLWCHLSLPKSIAQSYELLESELIAFGLLPGESDLQFHETKTIKVLQAVYSRLPSAADSEQKEDPDPDEGESSINNTITVDSQESSQVEVSLRQSQSLSQDENDENVSPHASLARTTLSSLEKTILQEDDKDWPPPSVKASESSTTTDTVTTFEESDNTTLARRSTRRRKPVS